MLLLNVNKILRRASRDLVKFIASLNGEFFGYELMETFDFDGPKRDGIKKRVYFFKKE